MITVDKLKTIAKQRHQPSLSIYLPTSRAGRNLEDQLHFKNALSEAHEKLVNQAFTSTDAHRFLKQGYELLDNDDFWLNLSDGLVLFIAEDYFDYFIVSTPVKDRIQLGNKFYIRPLLSLVPKNKGRFFKEMKKTLQL